jgi:WD40 repeat protein
MEVLPLSTSVQESRNKYESVLLELEIQKVANSTTILQDVPTLPNDVRIALRYRGLPVRYFGENLMNIRNRLRYEIAKEYVLNNKKTNEKGYGTGIDPFDYDNTGEQYDDDDNDNDEEVTKYTRAGQPLIDARKDFTTFSIMRAKERLYRERLFRHVAADITNNNTDNNEVMISTSKKRSLQMASHSNELKAINDECFYTYKSLRQITLEGTQYGDNRALSCISVCHYNSLDNVNRPLIVTASWTGSIQLWDGQSSALSQLSYKPNAHTDRIMGIATTQYNNSLTGINFNSTNSNTNQEASVLVATTSIDMTAKLWKVKNSSEIKQHELINDDNIRSETIKDRTMSHDEERQGNEDKEEVNEGLSQIDTWTIDEIGHYKGHKARLCRVAFHPMKQHIATTSFDNTWRLWDINRSNDTSSELLLQDGHCSQVYGIGFHPDGNLVSTSDYSGVIQLWDIRTGKSIRHFIGHARRVLNVEFHPINGYQLASAGDDGTIRIWDIRKRKHIVSIPAHSNLITNIKFQPVSTPDSSNSIDSSNSSNNIGLQRGGEFLVSSSFDGTVRIWNTRNWKLLNTLRGHNDGKITGVDIVNSNTLVTCGLDKTLKMWK